MIELRELRFTRERLAKMDKKERDFLIVLGHVTNDLMSLHRLVIACHNYPTHEPILTSAGITQSLVVTKMLIGLICESWTFVCRELLHPPLLKLYMPIIEQKAPEGKIALDKLKDYFQGTPKAKRHLTNLRNDFAFHYDSHKWNLDIWQQATDDELVFYLSHLRVNSFYQLSGVVTTRAMLSRIDPDVGQALKTIFGETIEVVNWLLTLTHSALLAAAFRYLGEDEVFRGPVHQLSAAPALESVTAVPWFIEERG